MALPALYCPPSSLWSILPVCCMQGLTEGQVEQSAVRSVHVTGVHVVLLCWPVYAVIRLSVELLGRERRGEEGEGGRGGEGRGGERRGRRGEVLTVVLLLINLLSVSVQCNYERLQYSCLCLIPQHLTHLSELQHNTSGFSCYPLGIAVPHWEVDLPAVAPQLGGVHREPAGEDPTMGLKHKQKHQTDCITTNRSTKSHLYKDASVVPVPVAYHMHLRFLQLTLTSPQLTLTSPQLTPTST